MSLLGKFFGFNPVSWFCKTRQMRNLVDRCAPPSSTDIESNRIAVVILPWLGTDVPWFSVVFGLLLAKHGNCVVFVVDDLPFGDKPTRFRFLLGFIKSIMRKLSANYEVLVLSDFLPKHGVPKPDVDDIDAHVNLNTVWALRGELAEAGREGYRQLIRRQLQRSAAAVAALLSAHRLAAVLLPGGIYGSSGLWKEHALTEGVRVATYDSGAETLLLAAEGVASQLQDIPRAMLMLKSRPEFKREQVAIVATAMDEMEKRMAGKDKFLSQLTPREQPARSRDRSILLALNSPWDSAALGLHVVFEDTRSWIIETTSWVLEHSDADVVIRQHPAERFDSARSKDDYSTYLLAAFGANDRVRFIAAEDSVNTYDLLDEIKTVIVYTSTIGVEAALLGDTVITASKCYYSSLGFVFKANCREEYFKYIQDSLDQKIKTTEQMRQDAAICYYLTQCNNWIFTKFNPHCFDFWGNQDVGNLYLDDNIRMCIESVSENIPVAILNHVKNTRCLNQE